MQIDFSKLDKSDFKCLKTADGAIYYGQVVQILPPSVKPENLAGFKERAATNPNDTPNLTAVLAHEKSTASLVPPGTSHSGTALSQQEPIYQIITDGLEPLVVEDYSLIEENLKDKLLTVRHGFGIQL